ncbi:hypothetical protein NFI96_000022 [Prochilodus magdalenae]|nr:hypothetical protein NFI96_000022 [Prochilodus magdalenae]
MDNEAEKTNVLSLRGGDCIIQWCGVSSCCSAPFGTHGHLLIQRFSGTHCCYRVCSLCAEGTASPLLGRLYTRILDDNPLKSIAVSTFAGLRSMVNTSLEVLPSSGLCTHMPSLNWLNDWRTWLQWSADKASPQGVNAEKHVLLDEAPEHRTDPGCTLPVKSLGTPISPPVSAAPSADGCTTQDYMHTDRYHDCP